MGVNKPISTTRSKALGLWVYDDKATLGFSRSGEPIDKRIGGLPFINSLNGSDLAAGVDESTIAQATLSSRPYRSLSELTATADGDR